MSVRDAHATGGGLRQSRRKGNAVVHFCRKGDAPLRPPEPTAPASPPVPPPAAPAGGVSVVPGGEPLCEAAPPAKMTPSHAATAHPSPPPPPTSSPLVPLLLLHVRSVTGGGAAAGPSDPRTGVEG